MTARRRRSAARARAMLVAPDAATFPQELFIKLRRAGWPVSPVLEGRVQVNGRSVRLLGIEPVTHAGRCRQRAAPRRLGFEQFRRAARPDAGGAGDAERSAGTGRRGTADQQRRKTAAAACAAAARARRTRRRYRRRAAAAEQAGPGVAAFDRQAEGQAGAAGERRRRPACSGSSRMRRRSWSASPTAFISTSPPSACCRSSSASSSSIPPSASPSSSGCRCCARCGPAVPRRGWSTRCWWSSWWRWRWSQA